MMMGHVSSQGGATGFTVRLQAYGSGGDACMGLSTHYQGLWVLRRALWRADVSVHHAALLIMLPTCPYRTHVLDTTDTPPFFFFRFSGAGVANRDETRLSRWVPFQGALTSKRGGGGGWVGLISHHLHRLKTEKNPVIGWGGWLSGVVGAASSNACVGDSRWGRGPTRRATGRQGLHLTLIRVSHTRSVSMKGWQ